MNVHAVTYVATGDAPKGCEAIARLRLSDDTWHPVIIHAPTPDEAYARALQWWADEIEKVRRKREADEKRAEALKAYRAAAASKTRERVS